MEEILFKKVTQNQLSKLREISISTFSESFKQYNTAEDMEMYLAEKMNKVQLESELNNPGSEFYFALCQDEIIGYIKINAGLAQNEKMGPLALEIERIYVVKAWQGKGIGSKMLNFAFDLAQERKLNKVWLGVWEKNFGARKLYSKYGFKVFSSHPFLLGEDLQTDILMEKNL